MSPASNAIPGQFWKRKILSGRLADPGRPDEVNVSFTLAQRLHLRQATRCGWSWPRRADRCRSCSVSPGSTRRRSNSRRRQGMAPMSSGAPQPSTASTGRWTDSPR